MKLSKLFTGQSQVENHVEENGRASQYARTAGLNRQIHSLTPGQTIRGEIVSRSGGEVQIRLSEDMVMNARVDQSINLELGKNVTFEVKSNGGTLSLSPLYTNIAADANVLKALEMANLPVNDISVAMTEQLMKAGLPVNRSSLQQVYREINSFPKGEVSDVVNLHRLQLPVNEENMRQMASYRSLTHQLIKGITDVLEALPEAVNNMLAGGNDSGAAALYRELFSMIQEGAASGETAAGVIPQAASAETAAGVIPQAASAETAAGVISQAASAETAAGAILQEAFGETAGEEMTALRGSAGAVADGIVLPSGQEETSAGTGMPTDQLPETVRGTGAVFPEDGGAALAVSQSARRALADSILQVLDGLQLSPQEGRAFSEAVQRFGQGELSAGDFFKTAAKLLDAAGRTEGGIRQIHKLFGGKEFQSVLKAQMKELWTLRPEEVSKPEKVEELYRRLDRQIRGLVQALETGGQESSTAYRAAANLSQNVDFMNQINQLYTYVQLPLHLQQSEAHGELYVYTNKRSLADNNGQVSALLHLDMEQLGPVDVYVTLQEAKVNTKFYVADDEILDFIEEHMDILTGRLEKRGYSCSVSMTARGDGEKQDGGGLAPLLQQEKGILLSQYAFDVRT